MTLLRGRVRPQHGQVGPRPGRGVRGLGRREGQHPPRRHGPDRGDHVGRPEVRRAAQEPADARRARRQVPRRRLDRRGADQPGVVPQLPRQPASSSSRTARSRSSTGPGCSRAPSARTGGPTPCRPGRRTARYQQKTERQIPIFLLEETTSSPEAGVRRLDRTKSARNVGRSRLGPMSLLLRVELPDVPGSLGRLARRSVRPAATSRRSRSSRSGTTARPSTTCSSRRPVGVMPDSIVSACNALDGVEVVWISRYAAGSNLFLDLEVVEELTGHPGDRARPPGRPAAGHLPLRVGGLGGTGRRGAARHRGRTDASSRTSPSTSPCASTRPTTRTSGAPRR